MTINSQFPSARPALAHAGRSTPTATQFVGVFSLGGGQSLGFTPIDQILIKCLKSGPRAYLDCNVEYTNQTDSTHTHLKRL